MALGCSLLPRNHPLRTERTQPLRTERTQQEPRCFWAKSPGAGMEAGGRSCYDGGRWPRHTALLLVVASVGAEFGLCASPAVEPAACAAREERVRQREREWEEGAHSCSAVRVWPVCVSDSTVSLARNRPALFPSVLLELRRMLNPYPLAPCLLPVVLQLLLRKAFRAIGTIDRPSPPAPGCSAFATVRFICRLVLVLPSMAQVPQPSANPFVKPGPTATLPRCPIA